METITLKTGEQVQGKLIYQYGAFEGGMRYIFKTDRGEIRCVKDKDNNYIEYTV